VLVLTRKLGESIRIGDDVEIVVTDIGNGRIKLGIAAPRHVSVLRAELAAAPPEAIKHAETWLPATEWQPEAAGSAV